MRKSRCSEEQMVVILREAEKTTFTAAAKRDEVSKGTVYARGARELHQAIGDSGE